MLPNIHILNLSIPLYPVCVAAGFLFGTIIAIQLGKKMKISENKVFVLMYFVEIGVIIGGKLMFFLVNINYFIKNFEKYDFLSLFTKTGFVFFGGLFGGITSIIIFSKTYRMPFYKTLTLILTVSPLIHAIGRIGCFCAGCCYGIEYNGFSSIFIHTSERFPVQILEASLCLILFFILLISFIKKKEYIISLYFSGYGTIRFFCEFLRGDTARGFIGILSISSWLSLICILFGILRFFQIKQHRYICNE